MKKYDDKKSLKKLSRLQLLEMLLVQTEKVEQLERQLEENNKLIESLQNDTKSFESNIDNIGSLAQYALEINEVFLKADKAATDYVNKAKELACDAERLTLKRSVAAKIEMENIINDAYAQAEKIISKAKDERRNIILKAKIDSNNMSDYTSQIPLSASKEVTDEKE